MLKATHQPRGLYSTFQSIFNHLFSLHLGSIPNKSNSHVTIKTNWYFSATFSISSLKNISQLHFPSGLLQLAISKPSRGSSQTTCCGKSTAIMRCFSDHHWCHQVMRHYSPYYVFLWFIWCISRKPYWGATFGRNIYSMQQLWSGFWFKSFVEEAQESHM